MADQEKTTEKAAQTDGAPVTERWTEIEHLTEWDEEFYFVYTAKKFGKWVMLKTLRPEYRDKPEYQQMLEKEFEIRYNLAHPNIVMINDLEDVPGLGRCIITDDVYGMSLRKLIDQGKVTQHHIDQLKYQLPAAIEYIHTNHIVHHPIKPERIIFTENIENLKLIDVGFDQKKNLTNVDVSDDIYNYGLVLRETLDRSGIDDYQLRRVAVKCLHPNPERRYTSANALRLALDGKTSKQIYISVISFLLIMIGILVLLILHK